MSTDVCFQPFFNYVDMRTLLENFCVYHVNAPGQEDGAPSLPEEWVLSFNTTHTYTRHKYNTYIGTIHARVHFILHLFACKCKIIKLLWIIISSRVTSLLATIYATPLHRHLTILNFKASNFSKSYLFKTNSKVTCLIFVWISISTLLQYYLLCPCYLIGFRSKTAIVVHMNTIRYQWGPVFGKTVCLSFAEIIMWLLTCRLPQ